MQQLFKIITAWQDDTFPNATALTCVNHLQEEVEELKADIENNNIRFDEIADCFMLLFGICNHLGLDYKQVCDILEGKHAINLRRKWGKVNEKGYIKHIE